MLFKSCQNHAVTGSTATVTCLLLLQHRLWIMALELIASFLYAVNAVNAIGSAPPMTSRASSSKPNMFRDDDDTGSAAEGIKPGFGKCSISAHRICYADVLWTLLDSSEEHTCSLLTLLHS
jgi:hypothetical protein